MKPSHALALTAVTLAAFACKEENPQVEDPNLPIMVYYSKPG